MYLYFLNKFQRRKAEGLWNLAETETAEKYGNFSNYANMDKP